MHFPAFFGYFFYDLVTLIPTNHDKSKKCLGLNLQFPNMFLNFRSLCLFIELSTYLVFKGCPKNCILWENGRNGMNFIQFICWQDIETIWFQKILKNLESKNLMKSIFKTIQKVLVKLQDQYGITRKCWNIGNHLLPRYF